MLQEWFFTVISGIASWRENVEISLIRSKWNYKLGMSNGADAIVTARQWSGEGNVFSRVCLSFCLTTGGPMWPPPRLVQTCSFWTLLASWPQPVLPSPYREPNKCPKEQVTIENKLPWTLFNYWKLPKTFKKLEGWEDSTLTGLSFAFKHKAFLRLFRGWGALPLWLRCTSLQSNNLF